MNQKTTYMPGPWEVENMTRVADESWFNILESHGFTVAEAVRDRATARMIAAAPDMLAALKGAEEWLSGWASAEPYIDVIRAAIAKAESA